MSLRNKELTTDRQPSKPIRLAAFEMRSPERVSELDELIATAGYDMKTSIALPVPASSRSQIGRIAARSFEEWLKKTVGFKVLSF